MNCCRNSVLDYWPATETALSRIGTSCVVCVLPYFHDNTEIRLAVHGNSLDNFYDLPRSVRIIIWL